MGAIIPRKEDFFINNYTIYHLHSDLSNAVTNIDSVTKFKEYISKAKESGMTALGFSEHGSIMEWYHKKAEIENAGMKYIHAAEFYLTYSLEEKIRDNYHIVLIAKNEKGFHELNKLSSASFNRSDNHFYYVPRISFQELYETSDNIIITTACIGGVLGKAEDAIQQEFIKFLTENKHRTFIEVGHHKDDKQKAYNSRMINLHIKTGIPLIAGTDTHALTHTHEKGRGILQASKGIHFENEDNWDLTFKTYDELCKEYKNHYYENYDYYLEAVHNTNVMANMVEGFKLDKKTKYPKIYDEPEKTFRDKIQNALINHKYCLKNHTASEVQAVIDEEFEVYKKTESIDFMLLQSYIREWEASQGIECGYGRGSVSGSMIAYLLDITQMDSMKFDLNFFRFMNPDRVTNADIDTDYSGADRDKVKRFLLQDKMNLNNINSAEIITFNTIALKGAIRDVCRALYKKDNSDYLKISSQICQEAEADIDKARKKYPEVFEYVDIVNGTIVSIGTHPSGILISDLPIDEMVGLCSTATSDYPVAMLNMKELDDLMYVKIDALGLDNIGVINETCKALGIERLNPDNTDLNDEEVWESIRNDTTLIFQWESISAKQYLKKFLSSKVVENAKSKTPNFSMMKWLSFGNGLIRPSCASFRESVAQGEFYDNGFKELNEFLGMEAGRVAMQETIMGFLVKFCGYSPAESDNVRRSIAKKKGTEILLPEIERRFIEFSSSNFNLSIDKCKEVIKPFLQIILDASAYAFSWNHSDAYSAIGYICGYLRHYHPYEFLTSALNIFEDNSDKTASIINYANKNGIKITLPKWGISKSNYFFDKNSQVIAKGLASIKYMNKSIAEELYDIAHQKQYTNFVEVLLAIKHSTHVNVNQLDILIKLDFFSDFGNQKELLRINEIFINTFKRGEASQIKKASLNNPELEMIISRNATDVTKSGAPSKNYKITDIYNALIETEALVRSKKLSDLTDIIKIRNFYDIMGYVGYISGKEEDRRKLYVTDIKPVHRKRDGKMFGYRVFTKSIGSGKESVMTVFLKIYDQDPINSGDIIYCKSYEVDGIYFRLTGYEKIY